MGQSPLPASDLERVAGWYGYLPGLVLAVVEALEPDAPHKQQIAAAADRATAEYVAAFEELGPDLIATLDHYVTELGQFTLDFIELEPLVIEALRGSGLAAISEDGRVVTLLPDRSRDLMYQALRTVVDSTVQLPADYLGSVQGLWVVERTLRSEVRRQMIDRHGADQWTTRIPGPQALLERLVSRASQAFPRATTCGDLPNPLEWMTLGELTDMILAADNVRPFGVADRVWERMRNELAPVRDRIAHMRLLREGDQATVLRWQREMARLQAPR